MHHYSSGFMGRARNGVEKLGFLKRKNDDLWAMPSDDDSYWANSNILTNKLYKCIVTRRQVNINYCYCIMILLLY